MKYPPPQSMGHFINRLNRNERVVGRGIGASVDLACPFCAAPDWAFRSIVMAQGDIEAKCRECGRTGRYIVDNTGPGSQTIRLVLVAGDDVPDWYTPKPERLNPPPADTSAPAPAPEAPPQ